MERFPKLLALACVIFTGGLFPVWAQHDDLELRKGTIRYPDSPTENVKYQARMVDGHLLFLGLVYFEEPLNFDDVKVQEEEIIFMFTDESVLLPCSLKKQNDQSYLGSCRYPESEKKIVMKIFAPKPAGGDDQPSVVRPPIK